MSVENVRLSIPSRLGMRISGERERAKDLEVNDRFSGRFMRMFRENTRVGLVERQGRVSGNMGAKNGTLAGKLRLH